MKKKFPVALAPQNWRFDPFCANAPKIFESGFHLHHRCKLCGFIAHDPAFTHRFPARLELGFHEDHNLAAALRDFVLLSEARDLLFAARSASFATLRMISIMRGRTRPCRSYYGWQNLRSRNERDIHRYEIDGLADVIGVKVAGVCFFPQTYPWVVAQSEIHLPVASVDGDDFGGAVLQHAIAEPSGRRANIKANFIVEIDVPVNESFF